MICKTCQQESNPASKVCPFCGQYMGQESSLPEIEDAQLLQMVDERRWIDAKPQGGRPGKKSRRRRSKRRSRLGKSNTYQNRMVNWVKVAVLLLGLALALLASGLIWLQVTPQGQLIKARMGRAADATAFWSLGSEYLDQGYIEKSIQAYLKAESLEPERKDLDQKLLLLAEAYEAAGQMGEAEAVYKRIYQKLAPEKPAAYRLAISILLEQNRLFEAVALMKTAHEKTGDEGFANERSQLVPQPPKASLAAGRHMYAKTIEFISTQDYEIRYTTGDGLLPETGTLYTGPITLQEGTYNFRAVAISNDLVSNEMSIRYIITLPTPMAPKTNMASGTYERQIKVSLRIVDEEDKNQTLYYTLDGSKPNLDSPRYTGEPILIPTGKSVLRAIAVNRWGKLSSEMMVEYTVSRPYKTFFQSEKDHFADFTLLKTSKDQFYAKFGQPQSEEEIQDEAVSGKATKAVYAWGEARFFIGEKGEMVYHVHTSQTGVKGPRKTSVGMLLDEVTKQFRDKGQPANEKGDRGLYYDMKQGYARYTVASDHPDTGTLEYVYVGAQDASTTILRYSIEDGRVKDILIRYLNRRLSMVE